jgi:hypothetical protein
MPRSGPAVEIERRSRWLLRHTPMPLLWWHTALTGTRARSLTQRRGGSQAFRRNQNRAHGGMRCATNAQCQTTLPSLLSLESALEGRATRLRGQRPVGWIP